ncbi:MAG: eukaryotic-like serine/threonine-protein kinase [Acidimicrobiaceae bacterium]|nr:eukaryotic-like serine/threonine-protein kinase [Acidimicrobiaceae bacterium]
MDGPLIEDVVLAGRYRLGSLLGAGGMAEVYDGQDERLARPVAVKLLRPDLAAVPDLRRRFELEARAAARLTHPNVVAVFDAGEDNGRSYIVMERLRGESLADTIGRGPVDLAWLHRLAGEVLGAVGAAHEAGIIHRDIKPANILLGPDGRAKVADFGIARVIESPAAAEAANVETASPLTGIGLVVGTPAYLAPERAMGEPATPQSDLYSVGVVLYEALTGAKPFPGKTPVAIAAAAVQGTAQDPMVLRPDADRQFVSVIGRAMALDPADRYSTAAEMAADLRRHAPPVTEIMPAGVPVGIPAGAGGPLPRRPVPPPMPSAIPPTVPAFAAPTRAMPGSPGSPELPGPPGPPASPFAPHHSRRWVLPAVGAAAVLALVLGLVIANPGSGTRASSTATTAPAATNTSVAPGTTAPRATTPTTASTLVGPTPTDPVAVAIQAIAARIAKSKSAAAGQLAAGLSSVAVTPDGSSRASAASSLLGQVVQWYQQGQLTTSEYVQATGILHAAGAPVAPPATVKRSGNGGGGGGGD